MSTSAGLRIRLATARSRVHSAGVSLVELMVAIGVTSLVAVVLLILSASTGRSFVEMVNYVDLDHYNRVALDVMSRDIRQVRYLESYTSNSLVFVDKDGGRLRFDYSPTAQTIVRTKGTEKRQLLDNCDRFQIGLYQRTPMSNRFDMYPVSAVTNAKLVRVTWNCSRTLFGRKVNTEQSSTARIVIRNKKEL